MPEPRRLPALRRAVRLVSYKVLNDDGDGSDAKIIKALDHIYELNRNALVARRSTA